MTRTIRTAVTGIFFMLLALFLVSCGNASAGNGSQGACTTTTDAAFNACGYEVDDDYWIALGNCANLANAAARSGCEKEAREERKSGKEDCRDQRDAREEICEAINEDPYDPVIDPGDFLDKNGIIANPNPWFPLIPGTTWVYEGGDETITVTVTNDTKEILGVTCIVVRDVVEEDGDVIEDTVDWYAQDIDGNVWYFGEISQEFEDGELISLDGSWKAGVDGAKAGIIMKANPQKGDVYRQEFALGEAEDMGEVLDVNGSASVPAASCSGTCVITRDWTPLEPDGEENKYYAPGIGAILEVNPDTGERVELVEFIP
ncbi:MAG: hypothetical protein JSU90_00775 [Nitrospiraceae bacterium]|nr:MAG: hypothetical protein JSU90_00775 [Nitrospiraceae bacterium]